MKPINYNDYDDSSYDFTTKTDDNILDDDTTSAPYIPSTKYNKGKIAEKSEPDQIIDLNNNKKEMLVAFETRISIHKPVEYEDVKNMLRAYKKGSVVTVSYKELKNKDDIQRINDFMSGVLVINDGTVTRIDRFTWIFAPPGIKIDTDTSNEIINDNFDKKSRMRNDNNNDNGNDD